MRFSEILLTATTVTGVVWALDTLFLRHRRLMSVLDSAGKKVKEPWWVEYSRSFFPILLIVLILRSFLIEPFRIPSGSMKPTLLEGDFILVNKYDYGLRIPVFGYKILNMDEPKLGDVIVFKHIENGESIDMIKRVVGLPGDHIQYKDNVLIINGKPMTQEFQAEKMDSNVYGQAFPVRELKENLGTVRHEIFIQPALAHKEFSYHYEDVVVPNNCYYVMGDNRDNSKDSRIWGFVKDKDIQGRAFMIWMSWDAADHKIRWDRLGTHID
jgi:signal peptidase I